MRRLANSQRPWLFYRDGIDWQWLSHRQAAVRVARTVEALKQASATNPSESVPIRPAGDIETLVTQLAARPAGVSLQETDDARFTPPDAPKHFEKTTTPNWTEPAAPFADDGATRALLEAIGNGNKTGGQSGPRPIVFAAPEPATLEALAAATLSIHAAWALEPMAEAFVPTARWVRPTILVAPPMALDALAAVWDGSDRKWSRLQAVVARGAKGLRTDPWRAAFGCRVGVWKAPT